MKQKPWKIFALIIVLALFALLISIPQLPRWVPGADWFSRHKIHLGLDLQGGSQLIYETETKDIPVADRAAAIEGARDVIERRINIFGVGEPLVQTAKAGDEWKIIVELPGVEDVSQAIAMIGETPILEFKEPAPPRTITDEDRQALEEYNQATRTKAEEILKKALQPEADFGSLAEEHSEDPGSQQFGGDLGWFGRGMMVEEFEKAAFGLASGQTTRELVQTQFGYHIIKKFDERTNEQGEEEIQASHILFRTVSEADLSFEEEWSYTGLGGKHLKASRMDFDPNTNEPVISLEFNEEGTKLFAEITKRNIGQPVAIFLDGVPISVPTVQEEILGGKAVITGNFSIQEARELVMRLRAGALPVPINLVAQQNIGPSLGREFVQRSLIAGLIGLVAITIFMIVFYGFYGLIAVVALGLYILFNIALFKIIPVTLTLAGIAGFVISLGVAVDANVLVFERIKDEKRKGKSGLTLIEEGFRHAWSAIRDSNITTLISCLILYQFGTGLVRGFGLTLGLGVALSMFTALTVTRTILKLTTR